MNMLNKLRLTRRGYYQKIPFLSEITLLQDCLRNEPAVYCVGVGVTFCICHLANYNLTMD